MIEYFNGWMCDISKVREWEQLPKAAQEYITFIEQAVGCPVTYISVGPERNSIIIKNKENKIYAEPISF